MAVSLSMDAFSLALAYGTLGMSRRYKILLSFITGIYHFIMPLLGLFLGEFIFSFFKFDYDILVSMILLFIGGQMIFSSFKNDGEVYDLGFAGLFLFGFAVSIDSFSIGITLPNFDVDSFLAPFVFALVSGFFTFIGLLIGDKIANLFGKVATILGGLFLMFMGILFIL